MNSKKRIIIAVVAVVAIIAGAVAYTIFAANNSAAPEASNGTTADKSVASVITYNGSSFSLSASIVKSGSQVKIVNDSSNDLDFGSDPHPTHTDNPELNAEDIPHHGSKTITLTKKGHWGFHNHFDPTQHGNITVE